MSSPRVSPQPAAPTPEALKKNGLIATMLLHATAASVRARDLLARGLFEQARTRLLLLEELVTQIEVLEPSGDMKRSFEMLLDEVRRLETALGAEPPPEEGSP
ncbi:MAG: hypothetical protein HOW73_13015 [Polyangiaceae bacterium]|nr:hypothetical protein [Polyangiaceae bacterium]